MYVCVYAYTCMSYIRLDHACEERAHGSINLYVCMYVCIIHVRESSRTHKSVCYRHTYIHTRMPDLDVFVSASLFKTENVEN